MKLTLRAAGIMRSGPERELVTDYIQRAAGLSKSTGFIGVNEEEFDLRGAKSNAQETQKLLGGITPLAKIIIFDERGKTPSSRDIARQFASWRDDGIKQCYCIIGPADGFDQKELPANITRWAFGPQTWPHKLVRVMAAEQIYRALSILAGSPYHKD